MVRRERVIMSIPYFLTNQEWYKEVPLDENDRGYVLTDKAPPEAIESYNEFYSNTVEENGQILIINK